MTNRISLRTLVVLLVGAGMALVQLPVHSQPVDDLDRWPPGQLERDLDAELNDIYTFDGFHDRNALVDREKLAQELIDLLKDKEGGKSVDENDENHEDAEVGQDAKEKAEEKYEQELTYKDLEAEMEEAGTTVEDVVEASVLQADAQASGRRPNNRGLFRMAAFAQRPDGRVKISIAVEVTERNLVNKVKQRRG